MVFIKQVDNADAGDSDTVGGNDWDKLDKFFNDEVDEATAKINSTFEVTASKFKIRDVTDETKEIVNDVSAITTATTRTITYPDKDLNFGIIPICATKGADEAVVGSTTLQDDDDLVFAGLANKTYHIILSMIFNDSDGAGGFKFAFTLPTGATGITGDSNVFFRGTSEDSMVNNITSAQSITGLGAGTTYHAGFVVTVRMGGTAGNIQLQWAQNVASGTTTLQKGSSMVISES